MRTCGYCGYSVSDEVASYCPKCGKSLLAPTMDHKDILSEKKRQRRNLRIGISAGVGALLGLGTCAIQTNTTDMIYHSITNFIIYFFITYFIIWIIQLIIKPKA